MWRAIRITVLLMILVLALGVTWGDRLRTTSWTHTQWIGIYPVSADGRPATDRYMQTLGEDDFADIEEFFRAEAAAFGLVIARPVKVQFHEGVRERPPALAPGAGALARIWWSLRLRYYSWRVGRDTLADIRVFVLFHDPGHISTVPHSVGLQKGLVGVVHAFAAEHMNAANNIVIAHEIMHTLGATDKYDLTTSLPLIPQGLGDPGADPLYPQELAEIMAGRVAISPDEAVMPDSLADVVVGGQTAAEINWHGAE